MAVTKTHPIKSTLKAAIDYILNPERGHKHFPVRLIWILDIVKGFAQRAFNRLNLCNRHISASTPFISSMSSW
ncbi:hypothetical protein SAMN02745243_04055 [Hespellia stercorisuis DSM 15480]|uniref:Uncharacterized protein n=1 Tax=Hespellia stercorisuis DSM 15480 TaxID=1121950 RepID=A0A1M6WMA7_9FIRM|nr:hypothetical protein SAMN02745243_04055 [Hespellia stercorisuis DSM 15480]